MNDNKTLYYNNNCRQTATTDIDIYTQAKELVGSLMIVLFQTVQRVRQWKNFENPLRIDKVIDKGKEKVIKIKCSKSE